MKKVSFIYILILLILFGISGHLSAQVLDGKWKGYFFDETDRRQADKKQYLTLEFIRNADGNYTVYSFTNLSEFDTQCLMTFSMQGTDSLHLEEIELLKPANTTSACFQRFKLKLGRSASGYDLIMMGTWDSKVKSCGWGKVFFQKQK